MGSEWTEIALDEIAVTNPDTYSPSEDWDYVNYLDTGNITEGQISEIKNIERGEKLPSRARRKVKHGDVIYSTVRPIQRHYGIISEPVENMLVSTGFVVIRAKEQICDEKFLYYYLTQDRIVEKLQTTAEHSTSAYPSIRPADIESLKINLPPLIEQRIIAHILGTLDDKIELNRRMNETLEAMARAIFKSWFVNFDPVVFNAVRAGNPVPERFEETAARYRENPETQRLPRDILDLFPDRFEESELGEIPQGWGIGPLSDIARLITKTIQPKKKPNILWEHYSIPAFDENCRPKMEYGKKIKSGKYLVLEDAVLASKLNPRIPRIWLSDVKNSNVAVCSTEFMPFCPVQETWRPFLYELLKSDAVQERIRGYVSGSTGSRQRVRPKDIAMMPILIPDFCIIEKFCELISGLHNQILNSRDGALILSKIRDTLLPKLISGELRVPDAETFFKGVA